MLVLTRSPGQAIVIGENIRVELTHIDGNRAGIGITAPRAVPILRQELLHKHPEDHTETTPPPRG